MTKALLKKHRQSPRKVRLVVDSVKGKRVDDALVILSVMPKKAAGPMMKLIQSAAANAKNNDGIDSAELFIKDFTVDQGVTLKRWRPKWRGTAHPIRKRSSNIKVVLEKKEEKVKKDKK